MEVLMQCPTCNAAVHPENPAFNGLVINLRRSLMSERVLLGEQAARVESGKKKGWVLLLASIHQRLQDVEQLLTSLPEERQCGPKI